MVPPDPKRKKRTERVSYAATPPERRLSRDAQAREFFGLLSTTVQEVADETRRSRAKRLFLIQGEAGVGKSWFMDYLCEIIHKEYPTWAVITGLKAANFIRATEKTPYHNFLDVLQSCDRALHIGILNELSMPANPTFEDVAQWAGQLEEQLNKIQVGPLLLFFDELECWGDVNDTERETLTLFLRSVWQMLLRKAHIPCIIIGAARRPPPFNNPLLRLALQTYTLEGFTTPELEKLIQYHSDLTAIRAFIERNAQGNPWITQLLDINLLPDPVLFKQEPQKDMIRRIIFENIIDDRLPTELSEVLYQLAKLQGNGFQPEDELLPEGHTTLDSLIASSFVEYNSDTRCYMVALVLAGLFKE